MWEYNHFDELYHYGVPGMKWGHRKSASVMSARSAYKQARKDLRKAKVKKFFSKSTYLAGYDNVQKNKQAKKNIKQLVKNREKAAFKAIDAQAKYAYDKKLAKTGNKAKAEKASMKVHAKAMSKSKYGSGLPGSSADKGKGNTRYYEHMAATKGKKYANAVEKKYKNKILRDVAGGAAVLVGSLAVEAYIRAKNGA